MQMSKDDYHNHFAINDSIQKSQKIYTINSFVGFLTWRIGVLLLLLLTGGVFIWLLSLLFTKVLLRKAVHEEDTLSPKDYWRGAFSFIALPASLVLLLCYVFSFSYQMITHLPPDIYSMMDGYQIFSGFYISPWQITLGGIATAILFSVAFALRRVAILHRKQNAPKVLLWKRILGAIGSILFVIFWAASVSGKFPFPFRARAFSQAFNAIVFGTSNGYNNKMISTISAVIVIIGLLIYLYNTVRCWQELDDWKIAFQDFWHLLCGSALRWIALASVLYLLTLAIAIPVRAPLRGRAMLKVTHGDLAVLKMDR